MEDGNKGRIVRMCTSVLSACVSRLDVPGLDESGRRSVANKISWYVCADWGWDMDPEYHTLTAIMTPYAACVFSSLVEAPIRRIRWWPDAVAEQEGIEDDLPASALCTVSFHVPRYSYTYPAPLYKALELATSSSGPCSAHVDPAVLLVVMYIKAMALPLNSVAPWYDGDSAATTAADNNGDDGG